MHGSCACNSALETKASSGISGRLGTTQVAQAHCMLLLLSGPMFLFNQLRHSIPPLCHVVGDCFVSQPKRHNRLRSVLGCVLACVLQAPHEPPARALLERNLGPCFQSHAGMMDMMDWSSEDRE